MQQGWAKRQRPTTRWGTNDASVTHRAPQQQHHRSNAVMAITRIVLLLLATPLVPQAVAVEVEVSVNSPDANDTAAVQLTPPTAPPALVKPLDAATQTATLVGASPPSPPPPPPPHSTRPHCASAGQLAFAALSSVTSGAAASEYSQSVETHCSEITFATCLAWCWSFLVDVCPLMCFFYAYTSRYSDRTRNRFFSSLSCS